MELDGLEIGGGSRLAGSAGAFRTHKGPARALAGGAAVAGGVAAVVCGRVADCDDYDAIAAWGKAHLDFLRRFLPYYNGVPGGRWLNLLMNRIDPAMFQACFTDWVRETWPERPELVAIDGKTSRRSHDRACGKAALHTVSAFATGARLVLDQEAVRHKSNELGAIPPLLERLSRDGALEGAVVSIDATACNATIAHAIREAGAHYTNRH